jgi:transcriptional regulator with XRE-family HTH domain
MDNDAFQWNRNRLGRWLRFLRESHGYSLVRLAALTGLPHSEIYKVEVGQQECRIETLVALCHALGVTHGWILDRALWCNPSIFKQSLSIDALTVEMWRRLRVHDETLQTALIDTLSIACARAAVILRASHPRSLVSADDYPHVEWRLKFEAFAVKVERMGGNSLDRAVMLHDLAVVPFRRMLNLNLVAEKALRAEAENACKPRGKRTDFVWPLELPLKEIAAEAPSVEEPIEA